MITLAYTYQQTEAIAMINDFGCCPRAACSQTEWRELVTNCECYDDGAFYRKHEILSTPGFEMCEPDAKGLSIERAERAFDDSARYQYLLESGWLQA